MRRGFPVTTPWAAALAVVLLSVAAGCSSSLVQPGKPVAAPAQEAPQAKAAPVPETPKAPAQEAAKPSVTEGAEGSAVKDTAATKAPEAAPEETWLRSESGQEYRLEKLEKAKAPFLRLSPTRVRTVWGPEIEVDREDDTYFYFRVYREDMLVPETTAAQEREKRAAEVGRLLPAPLQEVDRFLGVDFGRGLPTSGQWRNGFEFADMNGDGFLDLVHGPARKGARTPRIFLGDGKGNWRVWREATFPDGSYDYGDVTVGDFNGDGHLDLFLGVHLLGLQALLGDGKGGFTWANQGLPWRTQSSEPLGFSSQQVQAVNWDGGPRSEVLALSEGPHMSALPTAGGLSQGPQGVRLYRNISRDPAKVVWELVNPKEPSNGLFGGDLQLAPGPRSRSFLVGSGAMNTPDLVFEGRDKNSWLRSSLPLPPSSYVFSTAPLRRAGSDKLDVVAVGMSFDGGRPLRLIDLYRRERSGWVRKILWFEEKKGRGPVRVATGDLDGNGLDDIVALGADGDVWILLQEPGDKWVLEKSPELDGPKGCSGYGLRVQDLDSDGRPEIALSWAGEGSALNDPTACGNGGSLRIWKLEARTSPAQN